MYKVNLPNRLKLSLVPVCVGVAMATVNDFSFNAVREREPQGALSWSSMAAAEEARRAGVPAGGRVLGLSRAHRHRLLPTAGQDEAR